MKNKEMHLLIALQLRQSAVLTRDQAWLEAKAAYGKHDPETDGGFRDWHDKFKLYQADWFIQNPVEKFAAQTLKEAEEIAAMVEAHMS